MPRSSPRSPSGKTGFNSTYDLNMPKDDLVDILSVATKGQLFQFNGALYKLKQISNVAMESPPRALVSMCVYVIIGRKTRAGAKQPGVSITADMLIIPSLLCSIYSNYSYRFRVL